MSDNNPIPLPIEASRLREVCAADRDLGAELLDLFHDESKTLMENLREGLAAGDTTRVREAAHGIKGAAGTLGFLETGHCATVIEIAARNNSLESAASQLNDLNAALERLDAAFTEVTWD